MITVLIDHNIEGQAHMLWEMLDESGWTEIAEIEFVFFVDVGLRDSSTDREVWRFAQAGNMFLLTANRNNDGDDSLEQTLQDENTLDSLPVITIGKPGRLVERAYRESCIEGLLDIILYPERNLGGGRRYIP